MKKTLSLLLTLVLTLCSLPMSAFATEPPNETTEFIVDIPYSPGETQTIIQGDTMLVVTDYINLSRVSISAKREVEIYDIAASSIYKGKVTLTASGVGDGKNVSISSYNATRTQASNSDLSVTKNISGNNTYTATITGNVSYTSWTGSKTTGYVYLYVNADGTYH